DKLNVISLSTNHKTIQTESQMKQIIEMGQVKTYLLHNETNSF
ncbi:13326_t:CDS:1, partial [Racocetra fulgida]